MDAKTPVPESEVLTFVEELFGDARNARERLAETDDNDCKIKDRITCLKYLEDIVKTYMVLKKDATDDPAAAGRAVRKYATAFTAKNAARGRKKAPRRPAAEPDEPDPTGDGDEFTLS